MQLRMHVLLILWATTACSHSYGEATTVCAYECGMACMEFEPQPCKTKECAFDYWFWRARGSDDADQLLLADKLTELDPESADGYLLHAWIYGRRGEDESARHWYARAIMQTHEADAHRSYADYLSRRGSMSDAIHHYAACAAIDAASELCREKLAESRREWRHRAARVSP